MSQFDKFKEKFKEYYLDHELGYFDFIDDFKSGNNPIKLEMKENLDEEEYDSYGQEDSKLKRIFYSQEFNIFVEFSGTRASYEGEEWTNMREVKLVEKIISVYE